MRPTPGDVAERVRTGPAGRAVTNALDSRFGPVLRAVGASLLLYAALRFFLRNNPPPLGVMAFGAIVGLLYAMVAFGLILIYRANRIINFAQAEMGAVSAVMAVLLLKIHHVPYLVALLIAIVSAVVSGWVVELVVVRRFARAPRLVLSVATIGVALLFAVIQFYLPQWFSGRLLVDPTPPKTPLSHLHFTIHPVIFDGNALFIVVVAALVVIGLTLFFRLTDLGIAIRASAENADRATLLGISVNRLSSVVWIIAAVLSALGVFLRIPVIGIPVGADIGPFVLLYALAAAVIARMESFPVALAAGVGIGVLEQSIYYFTRDPSVASALMLPLLLVAMLAQRRRLSRALDTGLATWRQAAEFRPIPPELRDVPEVAWGRVVLGGLVVGGLLLLPYVVGIERQITGSIILIYAIIAVSLVILTGWAGQISLGQWGLAGVGAMVAGGLAAHLQSDFFLTLVAAGVAGVVVSVLIGLPALRIQGLYLAVTTLAFAIAVQVWVLSPVYHASLLPNNAQTIERPLIYGHFNIGGPRAYYYLCLIVLVLALASARALRRSRAGRVIIAARDNVRGAQSYGVSVQRARLAAFAISGFWAAIAGGLFAYHQKVVEPQAFDPSISILMLLIVVIGGVTSLPGAMLGAAWIGVLRYGGLGQQAQQLATGVGVLILLWIMPGGLAQAFYGIRDALLRWVAERRGIVVPSLVADVQAPADVATMLAKGEDRPVLPAPMASAVTCPVCGEAVAIADVAAHEHFEPVPS
jgi:branched-chain amino acid transport system permease protein